MEGSGTNLHSAPLLKLIMLAYFSLLPWMIFDLMINRSFMIIIIEYEI